MHLTIIEMQEFIRIIENCSFKLKVITESYHVNSDECSVKEFCDFVYNDINELGTERLPVNIVAIYTNLTNEDDIKLLEECAHKLEEESMVRIVLVASKI